MTILIRIKCFFKLIFQVNNSVATLTQLFIPSSGQTGDTGFHFNNPFYVLSRIKFQNIGGESNAFLQQ